MVKCVSSVNWRWYSSAADGAHRAGSCTHLWTVSQEGCGLAIPYCYEWLRGLHLFQWKDVREVKIWPSTCSPCVIDINLFKFTFTLVFNYIAGDEVYIDYLWTRKNVLNPGLKDLSSASNVCPVPRPWRFVLVLSLGLKGLSLFNITEDFFAKQVVNVRKSLLAIHHRCTLS